MCQTDVVCIAQETYFLILCGLVVVICIVASILSPPFNDPEGDEERKAKRDRITPKRKRPKDE